MGADIPFQITLCFPRLVFQLGDPVLFFTTPQNGKSLTGGIAALGRWKGLVGPRPFDLDMSAEV
jgi:hypothetical protein